MGTAGEQGAIWGARAKDWAEANEPAWQLVYSAVLDAAGVRQATKLLDIGCGAGGALALAAARGALVSGLDAAPALAEIAHARLPDATIAVGEMENLPFASDAFDVVTGINAFQFAGDLVSALAETARVCAPVGTVAMLVWGSRERCDVLSKVMPAVMALLPPSPLPASPQMALSVPGIIEGKMREAGLTPFAAQDMPATLAFADLQQALSAILSASARAIAFVGEDRVRQAVELTLKPFTGPAGDVRLDNVFRLVLASPSRVSSQGG